MDTPDTVPEVSIFSWLQKAIRWVFTRVNSNRELSRKCTEFGSLVGIVRKVYEGWPWRAKPTLLLLSDFFYWRYPPKLFITFHFAIWLVIDSKGVCHQVLYHLCFHAQHYLNCSVICYLHRFTNKSSSFTYLIIYPLFPPHPLLISTSTVPEFMDRVFPKRSFSMSVLGCFRENWGL